MVLKRIGQGLPEDRKDWKKFMVGWLEFNVRFQHKYGYIRDEAEIEKSWKSYTCFSGNSKRVNR